MRTSDSEVRSLYRRATSGRAPARCPGAAELARLALGEVNAGTRAELVAHVAECSGCALELAAAREVTTPDQWPVAGRIEPRHPAVASRRRGAGRPLPWLLAAALAVLAVGGLALWQASEPPAPPTDVLRSEATGRTAVEPRSGAVLSAPPGRLSWPPRSGATGYRVRLFDGTGRELWQGTSGGAAAVALPAAPFADPAADGSYLWRVEIEGPAQRSHLGPYRFRVEAASDAEAGP